MSTALLLCGWVWISPLGSDRQSKDRGEGMLLTLRASPWNGKHSWMSFSWKTEMRYSRQTRTKTAVSTIW